jgi:lysophospholipase L1-like esterase
MLRKWLVGDDGPDPSSWKRSTRARWRRQCFEYHPVFGWWHIPNLDARLMLGQTFHRFVTNTIGMRDHRDFPHARPSGVTRVVALGDSYTAGDGVSNDQRATSLLEAAMPGLEILNFGLNGSGTDQQLLIFEEVARHYEADAYIWFFCVENIARNKYSCFPSFNWNENREVYRPKPYFELGAAGLKLHNVPVPRGTRPANALGDWSYQFPYRHDFPGDPYAIYREPESEHWQLMRALIARFLAQVAPKPVFLVPLPMYQHYLNEAPAIYLDRFKKLRRTEDRVHLLDVLPALQSVHPAQRAGLRFPDDPHYTSLAHARLAEALEYMLVRTEPELFGARTPGRMRR